MPTTELLNTLYVHTQGSSLHLDHDAVRVVDPDNPERRRLPLRRLDSIVAFGHISLSSELLARCADDGRSVVWLTTNGRFLARLDGPTRGNVLLRHAQHLAYDHPQRRVDIARPCIAGKLQNSRHVLLHAARDAPTPTRVKLRELATEMARNIQQLPQLHTLNDLLGCEGYSARLYFGGLGLLLRNDLDIEPLDGRAKRPPTDPANCLLSLLYGLLRSGVHGALEHVGLDPYVGYLHGLRPGKPSLALDMMEEFRPILADRLAITLLNRRQLRNEHFHRLPGGAVQLSDDARRLVLTEWQKRKREEWQHGLLGRSVPGQLLPLIQARILARHLRDELPTYVPWISK